MSRFTVFVKIIFIRDRGWGFCAAYRHGETDNDLCRFFFTAVNREFDAVSGQRARSSHREDGRGQNHQYTLGGKGGVENSGTRILLGGARGGT